MRDLEIAPTINQPNDFGDLEIAPTFIYRFFNLKGDLEIAPTGEP